MQPAIGGREKPSRPPIRLTGRSTRT